MLVPEQCLKLIFGTMTGAATSKLPVGKKIVGWWGQVMGRQRY